MKDMIDRKIIKEKLPHGYCKKIANEIGVTPSVISRYFAYKNNSERVEKAILITVAKLQKEKITLLRQIE